MAAVMVLLTGAADLFTGAAETLAAGADLLACLMALTTWETF